MRRGRAANTPVPITGEQPIVSNSGEVDTAVAFMRRAVDERFMVQRKHRIEALRGLRTFLQENRNAIYRALYQDLGKHPVESGLTEIERLSAEIDQVLLHLADWMEPETVRIPFKLQPASARVVAQPLGLVLVISPWNYPLALSLMPAVSAMAAGNSVVLKPSEISKATTALLVELLPKYLDAKALTVVPGDADTAQHLLGHKFDHIFFTGSQRVGKAVYRAAAEQLTPVTLELGGKCPVVVTSGNAVTIARRIVYGKFTNAGQTCVAPDYVLATSSEAYEALVRELPEAIKEFYGKDPSRSTDLGRMINRANFTRVSSYLGQGKILCGGRTDVTRKYIEPTVLVDVHPSDAVLREEIFGPVLPVLQVESLAAAIEFIRQRPEPLAAYLFSDSHRQQRAFEEQVRAGAIVHNVTLAQMGVQDLPFGGVGASGFGNYHMKYGFDTFSQDRPVFSKPLGMDTLRLAYPPFTGAKRRIVQNWLGQ
ncbi:aldehyde dehydrogenase family protein [Micrococcoides hystricis]|uniref:Aldehyde dehydrogenase n=1 Tax=Micrococcoides hystricis TaxID=1572761 RepID=A0ABV6PB92_9MICC